MTRLESRYLSLSAACLVLAVGLTAEQAESQEGTIEAIEIHSPALEGNLIGDPATRLSFVYLPPGYHASRWRYPVVFVLHGAGLSPIHFAGSAVPYDVLANRGDLPEAIFVFPSGSSRFGGSFYLNSEAVGDFGTYITRDLLDYIDDNYRTIPAPESRGIYGHSMGGWGSMRLALSYPDILGAVFSDAGIYDLGYEEVRRSVAATMPRALAAEWGSFAENDPLVLAFMAGIIPNPDNPPFFVDASFVEVDGSIQEPSPGAWERAWDRVVAHDNIRKVDHYLAGAERLRFIGFTHGVADGGYGGFTAVEQARILDRKLTDAGLEHTYIEHPGGHTAQIHEVLPLLLPELRTLPPELPDISRLSMGGLTAITGQPHTLGELQLSLTTGLEPTVRLYLDASALGERADIALTHHSDTEYTGNGSITAVRNGRFFLPIAMGTEDGDAYVAHRLPVDVYPAQDAVLFGDDLGPTWSLDANSRVQPEPGAFDDRPGLALASSGSWRMSFETTTPVSLFGYEALHFEFHPASYSISEGRDPRLGVGTVDLLEKLDLNLQQWQTVTLPLEESGLPTTVPLQSLRFTGNLQGTFYLGDVRLVAQSPPTSTAVVESRDNATPAAISLDQNYPNPFNSGTVIRYAVAQGQDIELAIYNLAGQKVVQLVDGFRAPGQYSVSWDGGDERGQPLASGLYLYHLQSDGRVETRKLLLLR
ncbi:MAG: T9SS type A sorting domain-containing protein [Gemmatimonadetes bacterium]|nr:T9SS type A sorting domain-containing protein [Gemmatimonadota bacterium]MBT5056077.1 T9SS type A sorting domain-containing protein [Gemmatimonadota bacterium]MBT5142749.1 T9SS type A sorting domain-containing protein [Gemmatimonadota bacterium]MBT5587725.1 T9SS type A sorting domain-containing protein [Gemmatimonadota bacterium]MBT5960647.1 T9SS type A sorting domain-containing protein [Gemmatimonadota bacterium]